MPSQRSLLIALLLAGTLALAGFAGSGIAADTSATTTAHLPLVHAPPPPPTVSGWLSYVNLLRALGNLPTISENAVYSDGAYKHARYMVKNNVIAHDENSALPFYTPEGKTAAQNSNIMVSSSTSFSDNGALDMWMTGPFHGVGVIDPQLRQAGFGSYREADGGWQMGAALNVLQGLGSLPSGIAFPLKWPADGKSTWLTSYDGSEYPDPLSSCPGYNAPSGAPIYLMLGAGSVTPNVTATMLTRAGTPLEHCVFSETTYVNTKPDEAGAQSLGRAVLASRDAVVIMPRQELIPGSYTVSVTANGTTHTWSFSVTAAGPAAAQAAPELAGTPPEP